MLRKIATMAAVTFSLSAGAASATTIYATDIAAFKDGTKTNCSISALHGETADRGNICNALGAPDQNSDNRAAGGFLSAGKYDALKFTFGKDVSFSAPIKFFEISFNTPNSYKESIVFLLTGSGGATFLNLEKLYEVEVEAGDVRDKLVNVEGSIDPGNNDRWILTYNTDLGPFDALWVFDKSGTPDGFDIDAISAVSASPVPLPAAGFLLIAGLGGLALMRRRA